jgi:hypothetical protein
LLPEIAPAHDIVSMLFGAGHRRQQHRRQNGNNGDDDQQFNQGERSSSAVLQTALFATRFSSASGELAGHGVATRIAQLGWVVDAVSYTRLAQPLWTDTVLAVMATRPVGPGYRGRVHCTSALAAASGSIWFEGFG